MNMKKYIINFTVQLEGDVKDLNMYRAIIAKDETELEQRMKVLSKHFELYYDEVWISINHWQIPEDTALDQMGKFLLTDDLIGWNKRSDYEGLP